MEDNGKIYKIISVDKFYLILAVILIHCNYLYEFSGVAPAGRHIIIFFEKGICSAAVPAFFAISGYFFFKGIEKFNARCYADKLKRRVKTLLIPYLLWNAIAGALFLFKAEVFHFSNYGILENGKFEIVKFLQGFWGFLGGYPFLFSFWFIRNLIVFCIISPLAYLVGRYKILFAGVVLLVVAGVDFYGFEYFSLGALIALSNIDLARVKWSDKISVTLIMSVIFLLLSLVVSMKFTGEIDPPDWLFNLVSFIQKTVGTVAVYLWARFSCNKFLSYRIGSLLVKSEFFIFAFHALYTSVPRKTIPSIIGYHTAVEAVASYFVCFIFLSVSSFLAFCICRKLFPRITSVLCGGRI